MKRRRRSNDQEPSQVKPSEPETLEQIAARLAGQLSTLPELASESTPGFGFGALPIILAVLREAVSWSPSYRSR
jgi:hypothetical protein